MKRNRFVGELEAGLDTLDAERTLATADSAVTASQAQIAAYQVALFLALGGGWETHSDETVH